MAACASAQHRAIFDQRVLVIGQAFQPDESFHPVFQGHKQAEWRDARDVRLERLPDALERPACLVVLGQVAFGFGGVAFAFRGVFCQVGQGGLEHLAAFCAHLAGQLRFQHAMHDQVGVTPDRAGEVQVIRERQPEVALVFMRILGLPHGSQQQRVDRAFQGRAPHVGEHFLVRLRGGFAAGNADAQLTQGQRDILKALTGGFFVDAVERGNLAGMQVTGNDLVGGQHQVFDQSARGFLTHGNECE